MDAETHWMLYVLLAVVALFGLGVVLGFVALKWAPLERLAFNSMAMLSDVGGMSVPVAVGLMLIFPPFLIMVGTWYVLVACGRTDPMKHPNDN